MRDPLTYLKEPPVGLKTLAWAYLVKDWSAGMGKPVRIAPGLYTKGVRSLVVALEGKASRVYLSLGMRGFPNGVLAPEHVTEALTRSKDCLILHHPSLGFFSTAGTQEAWGILHIGSEANDLAEQREREREVRDFLEARYMPYPKPRVQDMAVYRERLARCSKVIEAFNRVGLSTLGANWCDHIAEHGSPSELPPGLALKLWGRPRWWRRRSSPGIEEKLCRMICHLVCGSWTLGSDLPHRSVQQYAYWAVYGKDPSATQDTPQV